MPAPDSSERLTKTTKALFGLTTALKPLIDASHAAHSELRKVDSALSFISGKKNKDISVTFKADVTQFRKAVREYEELAQSAERKVRGLASAADSATRKRMSGELTALTSQMMKERDKLASNWHRITGSSGKGVDKALSHKRFFNAEDSFMRAMGGSSFLSSRASMVQGALGVPGMGNAALAGQALPGILRLGGAVQKVTSLFDGLGAASAAALGAIAVEAAAVAVSIAGIAMGVGALKNIYSTLIDKMKEGEIQLVRLQTAFQNQVQAAAEYMKAVRYAAKTPVDVSQVVDATAILRSFQFDPFAKADVATGRSLLDVLLDMAGAMGTDLATATHALYRAQVGEWEIMQNNFQISSRMIPQLRGLASGTKAYGEAIVKYLVEQKRFIGGQELMAQSIQGMWSNVLDAFTNTLTYAAGVADSKGNAIGETLYDSVRRSLRLFYDAVSTDSAVEQYAKQLRDVATHSKDFEKSNESLTKTFGRFKDVVVSISQSNQSEGMKTTQILSTIISKTGGANEEFYSQLDKVFGRGQQIILLGRTIGQIFKVVWDVFIQPFAVKGAAAIDYLFNGFMKSIGMVVDFQDILKNTGKTGFKSLEEGVRTIGKAMGLSAADLQKGLENLTEGQNKEMRKKLLGTQDFATKIFLVIGILAQAVAEVLKKKFAWISDAFEDMVVGFKEGFMSGFSGEDIAIFLGFLDELNTAFAELFGRDKDGQSFTKMLWQGIGFVIMLIARLILHFVELNIAVAVVGLRLAKFAVDAMAPLGRLAKFMLEFIWGPVKHGIGLFANLGKAIVEAFSALSSGDMGGFKEALGKIAQAIADIFTFKGVGDALHEALKGAIDKMKGVWERSALKQGLESLITTLRQAKELIFGSSEPDAPGDKRFTRKAATISLNGYSTAIYEDTNPETNKNGAVGFYIRNPQTGVPEWHTYNVDGATFKLFTGTPDKPVFNSPVKFDKEKGYIPNPDFAPSRKNGPNGWSERRQFEAAGLLGGGGLPASGQIGAPFASSAAFGRSGAGEKSATVAQVSVIHNYYGERGVAAGLRAKDMVDANTSDSVKRVMGA